MRTVPSVRAWGWSRASSAPNTICPLSSVTPTCPGGPKFKVWLVIGFSSGDPPNIIVCAPERGFDFGSGGSGAALAGGLAPPFDLGSGGRLPGAPPKIIVLLAGAGGLGSGFFSAPATGEPPKIIVRLLAAGALASSGAAVTG